MAGVGVEEWLPDEKLVGQRYPTRTKKYALLVAVEIAEDTWHMKMRPEHQS